MDRRLLDILCCPTTKQPLALLDAGQIQAVNRAIGAGGVRRGDGTAQRAPIKQGLLTRDRKAIYRIDDDIPVLLADEAIDVVQIADFPA